MIPSLVEVSLGIGGATWMQVLIFLNFCQLVDGTLQPIIQHVVRLPVKKRLHLRPVATINQTLRTGWATERRSVA